VELCVLGAFLSGICAYMNYSADPFQKASTGEEVLRIWLMTLLASVVMALRPWCPD
jgi:hypothetical protein